MQVERIEWVDSVNRPGWVEMDEVEDYLDAPDCVSIGYVVGESDDWVYISTTVSETACLAPVKIPLAAITHREIIYEVEE